MYQAKNTKYKTQKERGKGENDVFDSHKERNSRIKALHPILQKSYI